MSENENVAKSADKEYRYDEPRFGGGSSTDGPPPKQPGGHSLNLIV